MYYLMSKPNLKMLQYRNQVDKYLNANKVIIPPKYECQLCQGYLIRTDWAPTCENCGSVHIDYHYLKFKNDDQKKPKKCYIQEKDIYSEK